MKWASTLSVKLIALFGQKIIVYCDIEKRAGLKLKLISLEPLPETKCLARASSPSEFLRMQRAIFLNMPKSKRRVLEDRYKRVFGVRVFSVTIHSGW